MEMDINKVAMLARIKLNDEDAKRLSPDLEKILGYVKKLDELDTTDVPPTSHVLDLKDVFREDEVKTTEVLDEALEHAPDRQDNFFRVPKVIEGN